MNSEITFENDLNWNDIQKKLSNDIEFYDKNYFKVRQSPCIKVYFTGYGKPGYLDIA